MKISEATGLCECGCGKKTTIPTQNSFTIGRIAGVPMRFVVGHSRRKRGFPDGVIVDARDQDLANESWVLCNLRQGSGYAYMGQFNSETKKIRRIALHRIICTRMLGRDLRQGEVVDHINGNSLDNRRLNLRPGSQSMNCSNRLRHDRRNKSGYRGVVWHKQRHKWAAQATYRGRHIHIGLFEDVKEAAKASHEWRLANMIGYTGEIR